MEGSNLASFFGRTHAPFLQEFQTDDAEIVDLKLQELGIEVPVITA